MKHTTTVSAIGLVVWLTGHTASAQRIGTSAAVVQTAFAQTTFNGTPSRTSAPSGALRTNPWILSDSQGGSSGSFAAEFSVLRTESAAGHPLVQFQVRAFGGVTAAPTNGRADAGGDFLLGFSSLRPHVGTAVIRYHSTGIGNGALSVAVDVGFNGRDFLGGAGQAPIEVRVPAAIGPAGLSVYVTATATAAISSPGNADFTGFLDLEFVPQASALAYGTVCPFALDADTSSTLSTDTFVFQVTLGPWLATAILALGTTQLAVPIPPSNCLLLVDPFVFIVVPLNQSGAGSIESTVPHVPGLSFFAQALIPRPVGSGWSWQTSNGQQYEVH